MGIAPSAFEQRVRSKFVPLFHLSDNKVSHCLGSYKLCKLLSKNQLANAHHSCLSLSNPQISCRKLKSPQIMYVGFVSGSCRVSNSAAGGWYTLII